MLGTFPCAHSPTVHLKVTSAWRDAKGAGGARGAGPRAQARARGRGRSVEGCRGAHAIRAKDPSPFPIRSFVLKMAGGSMRDARHRVRCRSYISGNH